ncbi:MAG TPA: helix-turn-helix transcriptional regulator, partial [Candidatus Deferrimicrobium sp.]|nr:helix-turn-helix transcriptional regulator [Candidatus Deferrimicrobium sp.]
DEAYACLKEIFKVEEKEKLTSSQQWNVNHNVPEFQNFSGNALKLTREVLGVELKEIALFTGIPEGHLKNIELERLDLLPPLGYIKVFLRKYAEYLSLDPQKVAEDYLALFEKKKKIKN